MLCPVLSGPVCPVEILSSKVHFNITCLFSIGLDEGPSFRYQVFAGERVFFRCPLVWYNSSNQEGTLWFIHRSNGTLKTISAEKEIITTNFGTVLYFSPAKIRHSGTYMCKVGNTCTQFNLTVLPKNMCTQYGDSEKYFTTDKRNVSLSCPSLGCEQRKNLSDVTWYRTENFSHVMSPVRYTLKITNGDIIFNQIYVEDTSNYTCDFPVFINGTKWIVRATVELKVAVPDTQKPPNILNPSNGTEIMAELGKPLNLNCRIQFGYERYFNPVIKWIILYPNSRVEPSGKNICTIDFYGNECIFTSHIEKITESELHATFYCHAQNSIGNVTTVIKVSRKHIDIVFLIYILCASVLLLIIIVLASGMAYIYWTEIVLLYRYYISKDETIGDNKDFDAFISYASQSSEISTDSEESHLDIHDDGRFATQLLPKVLEHKYNYKLCILERDVLPGGAYVEDIAKIIKRSRRVITILSERYITGPKVFELEAAITCSLEEKKSLKLILIKLKPFKEPENLPHVVKKALNALPVVNWKGDLDSKSFQSKKFWNRIRYYMPVKKDKTGEESIFQHMN